MVLQCHRSALELTTSISLENTQRCAVFQEEDSLSGCSSSTNSSPDESTEPTNNTVDFRTNTTTLMIVDISKEHEESWD